MMKKSELLIASCGWDMDSFRSNRLIQNLLILLWVLQFRTQGFAHISATNCNRELIFGEWTLFTLLFPIISSDPIISKIHLLWRQNLPLCIQYTFVSCGYRTTKWSLAVFFFFFDRAFFRDKHVRPVRRRVLMEMSQRRAKKRMQGKVQTIKMTWCRTPPVFQRNGNESWNTGYLGEYQALRDVKVIINDKALAEAALRERDAQCIWTYNVFFY